MLRNFKFRGYDNPSLEGYKVYYGDCEFTVGSVYTTSDVAYEDNDKVQSEAEFVDDNGIIGFEEIVFFDEVDKE